MVPNGPTAWRHLSQVDTEADDSQTLAAARHDLIAAFREAIREIDPVLAIDEAGVLVENGSSPSLVVPVVSPSGHRREVRLRRAVTIRAYNRDICPVTLVACALASPNDLDTKWHPKRVGLAAAPAWDLLNTYTDLFRFTESARQVDQALGIGSDVLLIGTHGSGKTAIAAHFAETYLQSGEGVIWLDLSDPADGPESILATLLRTARHKKYLLVVDGVHANLPVVDGILSCVLRLRSEFGIVVRVLATGWHTVAPRLPEAFKNMMKIQVWGEDLIEQLINESALTDSEGAAIRNLAGGDVHLAATALRFYREHGQAPTCRDLQRAITEGVDDPQVQRALYWLACLCFFETDVSIFLTRTRFPDEADWLLAHGLIRASDSSYAIGPRTRAALILLHALDEWDAERRWGRPAELTWQYLQRRGERAIRALLSRLDLGGVTGDIHDSTRYLLSAWEMQGRLERHMQSLCEEDPRWGDRVGAAAFAAMALAASGHLEAWRPVARYLRSRWRYRWGYELPAPDGAPTVDFADFETIRQRMAEQDHVLVSTPAAHLAGQPADQVDLERFYHTWVLGLLLGVEGTAPAGERRPERITRLVEIAERVQHPAGYFYPRRVPWITARVVLGLCQAGGTVETSETIRRAGNWLLRPVAEGGAFDLWWHSGTGTWNSDEVTTAICLTALFRAGIRRGPAIESALNWLGGQESRWTRPGHDVDLAHVLEALLLAPTRPADAYRHVEELLVRTLRALNDPAAEAGAGTPEESHRMPFATFQLASLVWTMVNREFTKLLDDVIYAEQHQGQPPETPAPAHPPTPPIPIPVPAPPPTRLTPRQLVVWRRAADQLLNKIHLELDERADLPRSNAIRRQLDQYSEYRSTAQRLAAELRDDTPDETLTELDHLGQTVCGPAWPDLPQPGTPDGS